jgi:2'-5' RNA ligase
MNELRSFIAIDLPLPVQLGLDQVINQLKSPKMKAVRWVPVKGIHLTLKFLGNVQAENLPALTDVLNIAAGSFHQFEFQVSKVGVFPNLRKPRIIWVGIQSPQDLFDLQKAIDLSTRPLGYPREDRPFSPHLTVGRISQYASNQEISAVSDTLASFQVGMLGVVNVTAITLFRSQLLPMGAVYTPLSEVKLSKVT